MSPPSLVAQKCFHCIVIALFSQQFNPSKLLLSFRVSFHLLWQSLSEENALLPVTLQIQCSTMDSPDSVSREPSPLGCNICKDPAIEPVITSCGHMYCWSCLYKWLHVELTRGCPVCRTPVNLNVNIIPLYGMQDQPIPEQRINHANNLECTLAIPPRPTAPTFRTGEESIEYHQAESPEVGAVERARATEERYQNTINSLWNDLQFSENERHQVEEAFNQMRRERDELWRETLQLRSSLRYWKQLNRTLKRDLRDNVMHER